MNKRIFKFRVWDNQKNNWKSEQEDGVYGWDTEGITLNGLIEYIQSPVSKDRFVIQQFTGLLDKNSKEIYEGDIVILDTKTFDDETEKRQIVFENGTFTYENTPYDYDGVLFSELSEVVGNTFENPELLK